MIIKALISFIKESIEANANYKYKIIDISDSSDVNPLFKCEGNSGRYIVSFTLNDIVYNDKLRYFSSEDIILILKLYKNNNSLGIETFKNNPKQYNVLVWALTMCLIISSIAATKICNIFGMEIDGGSITFPITYIITDLITEKYGFKSARRAILISMMSLFLVSLILYFITLIPAASGFSNHEAFSQIFSFTPIIFLATILSYLIGELTNSFIMFRLKLKYNGKYFLVRAITSTMCGALLDTSVFCYVAFFNVLEVMQINKMILILVISKVVYELLFMPITIKLLSVLKEHNN